jgi:protein lifeguard
LFTGASDVVFRLEGAGMSLVYGCYVSYDLHIISKKLSIDDYILGAFMLYADLITLFIQILKVVGSRK